MEGIVTQMIILFILVIVGFVANKCGYMGPESDRKLSGLILNFSCPALVLSSVMGESLPQRELVMPLLGVGFATYLILTPVALFLPRLISKKPEEQGVIGFMTAFGNVGFMGYPIVSSIFGSSAVFYASVLNFPNTFFVFVLGAMLVSGESRNLRFNWRILVSPAMIASYLSILIVMAGFDNIPRVVSEPIRLVGSITVPAALMIIGSQMAEIPVRKMLGNTQVYLTAAVRLLVVPVALFFIFNLTGVNSTVVNINTIIIGMPVATYGTILCLKYGQDMTLITQGTFITNLLSIITIPILTLLF